MSALKQSAKALVVLSLSALVSCSGSAVPGDDDSTGSTTASSVGSNTGTGYEDAYTTKVIFNKKSFYTNYSPSNYGCAGDVKLFYDTMNDRVAPVKPNWLRNISVDITNTNTSNGASNATTCGLFGGNASTPANCAVFDDLQSNSSYLDRPVNAILLSGCSGSAGNCRVDTTDSMQAQLWTLNYLDVNTSPTWAKQSPGIPQLSGISPATFSGLLWSAGDYDEVHDRYYMFGGIFPTDSTATTFEFSNNLVKMEFESDGTLKASKLPEQLINGTNVANGDGTVGDAMSIHAARGGFLKSNMTKVSPPTGDGVSGLLGHSFTYASRRHGAMKTWCSDADPTTTCPDRGTVGSTDNALKAYYEDQDFFLMVGGMNDAGTFQSDLWLFTPHGFSSDVGTHALDGGSWNLSGTPVAGFTTERGYDRYITKNSSFSAPYVVGGVAPYSIGTTFWTARAFHKVSYDPGMNRFYIFGGLTGSAASATASSQLWVYDPPAVGRRPTSTCYVSTTPDGVNLLPGNAFFDSSNILDGLMTDTAPAYTNLSINQNYLTQKFVFPPGGCLQRIIYQSSTTLPERFEHAQAFDRDQKALMVFGGCKTPSAASIQTTGATTGDPTTNCNSGNTLLGDTWVYLPPTTTEVFQKDDTTFANHPLSSNDSERMPNIFGTDFWLDHSAVYSGGGFTDSKTYPTAGEVVGTWIQLSPTTSPTKRVSASIYYDRNKHKFYLFGGQGCIDTACSSVTTLNDMWEFTPPDIATYCDRDTATCNAQGTWTKIFDNAPASADLPKPRKGAQLVFAQPQFSYGDEYYTVTDTPCYNQGPILTGDSSVSKQHVGAVYVDVDRDYITAGENLLISLRFLPFDSNTKLPGWFDNSTPSATSDDRDYASGQDQAVIRVQLLNSYLKSMEEIQTLPQPRFHNFLSGTPVVAEQFMYVSGGSGQITEKQILVPLTYSSSIDLIKIERIQGSVKFYEMSVSKF